MTNHVTGTHEEWLAARLELLAAEKELTRRGDELARRRRELPWVPVEKDYRFETDGGHGVARRSVRRALAAARLPLHVRAGLQGRLPGLLGDRRRLQRLRRPPRTTTTSRWWPSRGPRSAKLEAYKRRMGWTFTWASSLGQRLQLRLQHVASPRSSSGAGAFEYNYRDVGHDVAARGRRSPSTVDPARGDGRHRLGDFHTRGAGHERVRPRGRRRLPHLLGLRARPRRPLGHVPVARPGDHGDEYVDA